ncbi:hypothetical protein Vadar_026991 [Vaccinium darrowii]|uniref:Uncharacterized protein n=1 Tax=Vaccinium darrowii TaxID=229202 RepID=A0ACB7YGD7_9ERIC|nr:hypothetical protein Vadar_026991 [Vaccinium darrowii]
MKDNGCFMCWRGSNTGGRWNSSNYECKEYKGKKSKIVPKIEINKKALYCRKTPCLDSAIPASTSRPAASFVSIKRTKFYKDDNDSIELGKKQIMVCPVSENMEGDALKVKGKICGAGFFADLDTTNRTMPKEVGVIRREQMGTRKMSLVNMLNFLRGEVGPAIP